MKCIVLAGGYAKRLEAFFGTSIPKALLPIGNKLLLTHIVEKIASVPEIDQIIVSTNMKFEPAFKKWVETTDFQKPVRLVFEPTRSEAEKLGAIGGMDYVIKSEKVDEDILIVAGDNLFAFDLSDFLKFSRSKNSPTLAVYDIKDLEKAKLYGVMKLDSNSKVEELQEKPEKPASTLISTACYVFPKDSLKFVGEYMSSGNHADALGSFVSWLMQKTDVYAYAFPDEWFDIGDIDSLSKAREWMKGQKA